MATTIDAEKKDALAAPSPMSLIDYAVKNQGSIEVIKELRAMQQEDLARRAERDFNDAMERAQNEVSEIIPDTLNEQTQKMYASFKALNATLRPVYLKHGFTLSFNGAPSPNPEEIYVLCKVSHEGGHSEKYMIPMSTDAKGPKGGGVMSKQNAVTSATSYGRSVLLRMIFNLAIASEGEKFEELPTWMDELRRCQTLEGLEKSYKTAMDKAEDVGDKAAMFDLIRLKAECRKKLESRK